MATMLEALIVNLKPQPQILIPKPACLLQMGFWGLSKKNDLVFGLYIGVPLFIGLPHSDETLTYPRGSRTQEKGFKAQIPLTWFRYLGPRTLAIGSLDPRGRKPKLEVSELQFWADACPERDGRTQLVAGAVLEG